MMLIPLTIHRWPRFELTIQFPLLSRDYFQTRSLSLHFTYSVLADSARPTGARRRGAGRGPRQLNAK